MHERVERQNPMTVAALLAPGERPSVEAAGQGWFTLVSRDSAADALQVVRERPVDAILVSAHRVAVEQPGALSHLLSCFPGIPAVAIVSRPDPGLSGALLRLGADGVREVVDVSAPAGWNRLRQAVACPGSRGAARILGPLFETLPDLPMDARHFLETMVRRAPSVPVVRTLARDLNVRPSTLMSRFARAGLPSPKNYLASVRLLHAAQLFESESLSISDVAYRMEYSSPQSFGRHLRAMLGLTCTEFRRRFPFPAAMERFLAVLVVPYRETWQQFRPLVAGAERPRPDNGAV